MSDDDNLVEILANYLDKEESEIKELILTLDFKDLVKVSSAVRKDNRDDVINILHGYGL